MTLTKGDKKWVVGVLQDALEGQEVKFERKIDEVKNDFYDKIDEVKNDFYDKIDEVKDDFYDKIDPILKEVVTNREERTVLSHSVSDDEDRIENIEKKFKIQTAI